MTGIIKPKAQNPEFHWKGDIFFRRNELGEIEIVRRPKLAAYWTPEKGFHDPEIPILTIDSDSWESIVGFLKGPTEVRAALKGPSDVG